MNIILDECVVVGLKRFLPNHKVATIREMAWNGLKNGNLLKACVDAGFDVLLTVDKQMRHQQNISKYNLALIVIDSFSVELPDLVLRIDKVEKLLKAIKKRKVYIIT